MTPSKLKLIYNAFRQSELKYNRHKYKLTNAYHEIINDYAKIGDWENFDFAVTDAINDLGKSFELSKFRFEEIYKRKKFIETN